MDLIKVVDRFNRSADDRVVRSCKQCQRWQVDFRLTDFPGGEPEMRAFLEPLFRHHILTECPGAN